MMRVVRRVDTDKLVRLRVVIAKLHAVTARCEFLAQQRKSGGIVRIRRDCAGRPLGIVVLPRRTNRNGHPHAAFFVEHRIMRAGHPCRRAAAVATFIARNTATLWVALIHRPVLTLGIPRLYLQPSARILHGLQTTRPSTARAIAAIHSATW